MSDQALDALIEKARALGFAEGHARGGAEERARWDATVSTVRKEWGDGSDGRDVNYAEAARQVCDEIARKAVG